MNSMARAGFYSEFFGFKERPFTLLPDPDFIYWSSQHKRGYSVLEYGVLSRSPITIRVDGQRAGSAAEQRGARAGTAPRPYRGRRMAIPAPLR